MGAFDFLAVLLSIILGLGIAEVLQGYRRLILARGRVGLYSPPLIWPATLLAMAAQSWWAMFGLREHEHWSFAGFAILLMQTICLYLASALVLPDVGAAGNVGLRAHYFDHRRWFFAALIGLLLCSLVKDRVLNGAFPSGVNLGFHLGFIALSAAAIFTRADWYHRLLAPLVAVIIGLYIALLFSQL